jgi:hypothetical protein
MSLEHAEFTASDDLSDSFDAVMNLDGLNNPIPSVAYKRSQLAEEQDRVGDTHYVISGSVPNTIFVFSGLSKDQARVTLLEITDDGKGWDEANQKLYDERTPEDDRTDASVQSLMKLGSSKIESQDLSSAVQKELHKLLSTWEGATQVWDAEFLEGGDVLGVMSASVDALVSSPTEPSTVRRSATDPR